MPEILNLFVSPHAISQFQQRIALTDENKARRFILAGILQATNRKLLSANAEHPETLRIRTRRPFPFEFRAYCVFDAERGHYVVTTIVRGDSRARRDERQKARTPDSGDLEVLQEWCADDFPEIRTNDQRA